MHSFFKPETPKRQEIIFVMGGPASGKGTLCKKLEEGHGYKHISPRDLLRNLVKSDNLAEEFKKIADKLKCGELIDSNTVLDLISAEMKSQFLIRGINLNPSRYATANTIVDWPCVSA